MDGLSVQLGKLLVAANMLVPLTPPLWIAYHACVCVPQVSQPGRTLNYFLSLVIYMVGVLVSWKLDHRNEAFKLGIAPTILALYPVCLVSLAIGAYRQPPRGLQGQQPQCPALGFCQFTVLVESIVSLNGICMYMHTYLYVVYMILGKQKANRTVIENPPLNTAELNGS